MDAAVRGIIVSKPMHGTKDHRWSLAFSPPPATTSAKLGISAKPLNDCRQNLRVHMRKENSYRRPMTRQASRRRSSPAYLMQ
jgi:hypothetical protein